MQVPRDAFLERQRRDHTFLAKLLRKAQLEIADSIPEIDSEMIARCIVLFLAYGMVYLDANDPLKTNILQSRIKMSNAVYALPTDQRTPNDSKPKEISSAVNLDGDKDDVSVKIVSGKKKRRYACILRDDTPVVYFANDSSVRLIDDNENVRQDAKNDIRQSGEENVRQGGENDDVRQELGDDVRKDGEQDVRQNDESTVRTDVDTHARQDDDVRQKDNHLQDGDVHQEGEKNVREERDRLDGASDSEGTMFSSLLKGKENAGLQLIKNAKLVIPYIYVYANPADVKEWYSPISTDMGTPKSSSGKRKLRK